MVPGSRSRNLDPGWGIRVSLGGGRLTREHLNQLLGSKRLKDGVRVATHSSDRNTESEMDI